MPDVWQADDDCCGCGAGCADGYQMAESLTSGTCAGSMATCHRTTCCVPEVIHAGEAGAAADAPVARHYRRSPHIVAGIEAAAAYCDGEGGGSSVARIDSALENERARAACGAVASCAHREKQPSGSDAVCSIRKSLQEEAGLVQL